MSERPCENCKYMSIYCDPYEDYAYCDYELAQIKQEGYQQGREDTIKDFFEKCQEWNRSDDGKERKIPIMAIWHIAEEMRKESK